jgi:hypothetical protein
METHRVTHPLEIIAKGVSSSQGTVLKTVRR